VKFWTKLVLAAFGIIAFAILGGYLLGQYVPSLSSSLAQSLSIVILSVGIASSSLAVLSGKGLDEYFTRKREEKRIRSAFLSFLSGTLYEIIAIGPVFYGISETKLPTIPREFVGEIPQQLNSLVQSNVEALMRARPIDTSFYETNLKDHLLYLPQFLANRTLTMVSYIMELNHFYAILVRDLSSKTLVAKEAFPAAFIISAYLKTHAKAHLMVSELAGDMTAFIQNTIDYVLLDKQILSSQPILDKLIATNAAIDAANREFVQTLFPSGSFEYRTPHSPT